MSSIDQLLFIALSSALFFVACFLVFKQFRPLDKDGQQNSEALKETLRDLSVNQQQIVGSIKVITDTQTTSQAAIIKHVESRLEEIQKSISSSLSSTMRRILISVSPLIDSQRV